MHRSQTITKTQAQCWQEATREERGARSNLLDTREKFEVVEKHARTPALAVMATVHDTHPTTCLSQAVNLPRSHVKQQLLLLLRGPYVLEHFTKG